MSNERFTLCHTFNKHDWFCKRGFNSIEETEVELSRLLQHSHIETRLFPYNKNTPRILHDIYLHYQLTSINIPSIKLKD
jgi:hypothetical protein